MTAIQALRHQIIAIVGDRLIVDTKEFSHFNNQQIVERTMILLGYRKVIKSITTAYYEHFSIY